MELMQASKQWSTRPADERFVSLTDMQAHFANQRANSRGTVCSSRKIQCEPTEDNKGIVVTGPNGAAYAPTHWAFGQLAQLGAAPAGYLRTLPAPIAADCINYGLQYTRDIEDVGVLLYKNGGAPTLRAATGPNYGRIWNDDITGGLVKRFGDGISGDFRVPGEFGKAVTVTKENTTLFAGDRDMFVFLADEQHRITVPGRRDGKSGDMARGFFVWNSEVGSATFGLATFLFDYVCCNRIVWGANEYKEITIRHTSGAPDRFLEEMEPALISYANGSADNVVKAIEQAKAARLDNVDEFLRKRFSARVAERIKQAHVEDEGRPIETLWDATTGVTAYARTIKYQDERVALEREGGKILDLAAA
jgi:hypothetical protein